MTRDLMSLTPEQIRSVPDKDRALALIPIGAIEQHGPHLPVGVDAMIGRILIEDLNRRVGDHPIWFAPPITVSISHEHIGFPGTIYVDRTQMRSLLSAQLDSLIELGFRRVAVLNTHGGNTPFLRAFQKNRQAEGSAGFTILNPMPETGMPARERQFGIHAGLYESSILYARHPALCRPDLAHAEWMDEGLSGEDLLPEEAPATFAWTTADVSGSGTMGDPSGASSEQGDAWIRAAGASVLRQCLDLLEGGEN